MLVKKYQFRSGTFIEAKGLEETLKSFTVTEESTSEGINQEITSKDATTVKVTDGVDGEIPALECEPL